MSIKTLTDTRKFRSETQAVKTTTCNAKALQAGLYMKLLSFGYATSENIRF